MPKLNQILAIVAGYKKDAEKTITEAYHLIQKPDLFSGLSRKYQPKDENGDQQPSESKVVQIKTNELIKRVSSELANMFDIVATQDAANCEAKADIVVNGTVLVPAVPVTYLLFLEKQLLNVRAFIEKLPVLDPSEVWTFNPNQDYYASEPSMTLKSKKVPKNNVKYEATKEHPAQVEMYYEDVTAGTWTAIKFSGAIPAKDKNGFLDRVNILSNAVKCAREEANGMEVKKVEVGNKLLKFVFES